MKTHWVTVMRQRRTLIGTHASSEFFTRMFDIRALILRVHYHGEWTSYGFDGLDETAAAYASLGGKLGG